MMFVVFTVLLEVCTATTEEAPRRVSTADTDTAQQDYGENGALPQVPVSTTAESLWFARICMPWSLYTDSRPELLDLTDAHGERLVSRNIFSSYFARLPEEAGTSRERAQWLEAKLREAEALDTEAALRSRPLLDREKRWYEREDWRATLYERANSAVDAGTTLVIKVEDTASESERVTIYRSVPSEHAHTHGTILFRSEHTTLALTSHFAEYPVLIGAIDGDIHHHLELRYDMDKGWMTRNNTVEPATMKPLGPPKPERPVTLTYSVATARPHEQPTHDSNLDQE